MHSIHAGTEIEVEADAAKRIWAELHHAPQIEPALARTAFFGVHKAFLNKFRLQDIAISPVVEFEDWRAKQGIPLQSLEPAQRVTFHNRETDEPQTYLSDQFSYVELAGACAVAGWDFVIAPTGEVLNASGYANIVTEFNFMPHLYNAPSKRVAHITSPATVDVDAPTLFLSAPNAYHFGHWLIDFLPRLRVGKSVGVEKFAIPKTLPQHHRDTLTSFGIAADDLIECELGQVYRFKRLFVARPGSSYRPSLSKLNFMYEHLGPKGPLPAANRKRLYLERSGTPFGRRILNGNELYAILEQFGFEIVRRPRLSISEQNRLLGDAEIVLTPIGTDCLSVYQMRPGSKLVALCHDYMVDIERDDGTMMIASVCEALRIDFTRVLCKSARAPDAAPNYVHDLIIDPLILRVALQELCGP